jgi:PEP-CTERM motif
MQTKAMLATFIAGVFAAPAFAQSAPSPDWSIGSLAPGNYTISVEDGLFSRGYFSRRLSFGLKQDSEVWVTVNYMGAGTATLATRRVKEWYDYYEYPVLAHEVVADGVSFKLGNLADTAHAVDAPTPYYYLTLTSFMSSEPKDFYYALVNLQVVAVPEPGTWALMGLGLAGVAVAARRRIR